MSPWDPSLELVALDDAAEDLEREKLSEGFTAMLEALNQAYGTLQDVIIHTSQISIWSGLPISSFFIYFCFLTTVFFLVTYCEQSGEIPVPS